MVRNIKDRTCQLIDQLVRPHSAGQLQHYPGHAHHLHAVFVSGPGYGADDLASNSLDCLRGCAVCGMCVCAGLGPPEVLKLATKGFKTMLEQLRPRRQVGGGVVGWLGGEVVGWSGVWMFGWLGGLVVG